MVALLERPTAPTLPQEPATDPFDAALVWARVLRYRPADAERIAPWYGPDTCAMFCRELFAVPWGNGWLPLTPANVIAAPPAVLGLDWRDEAAMRQAGRIGTNYLSLGYDDGCACVRWPRRKLQGVTK